MLLSSFNNIHYWSNIASLAREFRIIKNYRSKHTASRASYLVSSWSRGTLVFSLWWHTLLLALVSSYFSQCIDNPEEQEY